MEKENLFISFILHNEGIYGLNLEFTSENKMDINFLDYLNNYISLFDSCFINFDTGKIEIRIQSIQKNSIELQSRVSTFIERYKKNYPQLHQLMAILKKIDMGSIFMILPFDAATTLSTKDKFNIENMLHELNGDNSIKLNNLYSEKIDKLLDVYDLTNLKNDKKIKIGEGLKRKRICRFCTKGIPETTFDNESHAISEALGNKAYILNEECDACNEYFSKTIEHDILIFLRFWNTFYGVKNKKNNIPKINQLNKYSITNLDLSDEQNSEIKLELNKLTAEKDSDNNLLIIQMNNMEISDEASSDIPDIKLEHDEIISQNIYKALVKFALSIIDSKHLSEFKHTLEWVRSPSDYKENLPLIPTFFKNITELTHPQLCIFIQKNIDKNLPYAVGIFHYTAFSFVFIIPTFNDEIDFTEEKAFNNFEKQFEFFGFDSLPWVFNDFSNSTPMPFKLNMTFEPNIIK